MSAPLTRGDVVLVVPNDECALDLPQSPGRTTMLLDMLRCTAAALQGSGPVLRCVALRPDACEAADRELLESFHSPEYVRFVEQREGQTMPVEHRRKHRADEGRTRSRPSGPPLLEPMSSDDEHGFADGNGDGDSVDGSASNTVHSSCPPFVGMAGTARMHVAGTLAAARALLDPTAACRVALFPWGGRHHAKRDRADGFCIYNDVAIAAVAILREAGARALAGGAPRPRVLVVDIDAHHGDGTQEAFYYSPDVVTVSAHVHGVGQFPGTGGEGERGAGAGLGCNHNIPLPVGAGDESIDGILGAVATVLHMHNNSSGTASPFTHAIVVAGTDALCGDPHGGLNWTFSGFRRLLHGVLLRCRQAGLPVLVTGAGGYVNTSTAICWSHLVADAVHLIAAESAPISGPGTTAVAAPAVPFLPPPLFAEVPEALEHFAAYSLHHFSMLQPPPQYTGRALPAHHGH